MYPLPEKPKMSQRQQRVAEVVRQSLSTILLEGKGFSPALSKAFITVTHVKVTPDLRRAVVDVSPLMSVASPATEEMEEERAAYLAELRSHIPIIRSQLTRAINLRYALELEFHLEEMAHYAPAMT